MGFSLLTALEDPRVERVVVVEAEATLVGWHRRHLATLSQAAMSDSRWPGLDRDARERGALQRRRDIAHRVQVAPGGVLGVWIAARSAAYEPVLERHFATVEVLEIPVPRAERTS